MQRAASRCNGANALPWDARRLGCSVLPEVNMMTSGRRGDCLGHGVDEPRARSPQWRVEPVNPQTCAKREVPAAGQISGRPDSVSAEFLDTHQELHRGCPQLRDEFAGLQQGAQRTSTAPMRVSAIADPGSSGAVRIPARPGSLLTPARRTLRPNPLWLSPARDS